MKVFLRLSCVAVSLVFMVMLSACGEVGASPSVSVSVSAQPTVSSAPPSSPNPSPSTEPSSAQSLQSLPQMDSSTARIPITEAIYDLFTGDTYGLDGPKPMASRTHGAWLNLADGVADIVFLVVPTHDELAYFSEKGVDIEMKIYGYDGLVFMGNTANPVQNLTSGQIRSIYSGDTKNWREVGGDDSGIFAYVRNPESGSQRLFESLVWDGYDMPDYSAMFSWDENKPSERPETIFMEDAMEDVTTDVDTVRDAVGYNIMSYLGSGYESIWKNLKLFSVDGYAPTTDNFISGDYPFLTTSYVAIRADSPEGSPARQLYDWIGSDESYALLSENSTLSVAFSESVGIRAAAGDPTQNTGLADMIQTLDDRTVQRRELLSFTFEEIGYLRNGIFALSGKTFDTERYSRYFSAQSWYKGTGRSDAEISQSFNKYQKENLDMIIAYEKELKRALVNR